MIEFRVEGPFEIEPFHGLGGRLIDMSSAEKFWADDAKAELAAAVGCYVFGFRTGGGTLPFYVGQSKTGFKHECFDHHKLTHYNTALVQRKSGTPIMFFVVKDRGPTNAFEALIDRVEYLLIQFALSRNPHLLNKQVADWNIHGVFRSTPPGKLPEVARQFRQCLGIFIHEDDDHAEADVAAPEAQEISQEQTVSVTEGLSETPPCTSGTPVADKQNST